MKEASKQTGEKSFIVYRMRALKNQHGFQRIQIVLAGLIPIIFTGLISFLDLGWSICAPVSYWNSLTSLD